MRVMKTAICPDKIWEVNYTKDCLLVLIISTRNTWWPLRASEGIESTWKIRDVFWKHGGSVGEVLHPHPHFRVVGSMPGEAGRVAWMIQHDTLTWCDSHHLTHIMQRIPSTSLDGYCGLQKTETPRILTHKDGKVFSTVYREKHLVLASAALLTTVPWCAWKIYVNAKFKWAKWESNQPPYALKRSASTNCATACPHDDSHRLYNFHIASLAARLAQELSCFMVQTATVMCCRYERTSQTVEIVVLTVPWRIYLSTLVH
jgi:hypothetical protein